MVDRVGVDNDRCYFFVVAFSLFWGGLNFDIGRKNSCLFWAMLLIEFYMFILVISGLQ